ncbi:MULTISPECIES: hypothetical protein [Vibrio]|uniref:hypothetical protein n=1 Tax=Vibrio TaxID=662 RepID=UPI001F2D6164|nr:MULTISPECIES: hypothetical protein [Vibrio]
MKKLITILHTLLFVGCSNTPQLQPNFIENVEYEHVIGEPNLDGKKISFTYTRKDEVDRKIVLNVDAEPIEMRFRLCEHNGEYENLSQGVINEINQQAVDCNSWFKLVPLENGKYSISYELNLLLGFQVENINSHFVYVPIRKKLAQYRAIYNPSSVMSPLKRYENEAIVESTTVEMKL